MIIDTKAKKIIAIVIAAAAVVLTFCTLREGLLIDENGLLAIYKSIYQGQTMFDENWAPYQMAGIITYPLFALYYQCIGASLFSCGIGFVYYMRISYVIIRLCIAIYLYIVLRKSDFASGAYFASLFYFLYIPSWRSWSYKSICDFGVILLICFAIRYFTTEKKWFFIPMGIATCISILAYPTMIILPVILVFIMLYMFRLGYLDLSSIVIYCITCFAIGAGILVYLQCTSGLDTVLSQIQYISDSDYENSLLVRVGMMLGSYAAFAFLAYIPIMAIQLLRKFVSISERLEYILLSVYWLIFMLAICLLRIDGVSLSRFNYGILIIFFWIPYLMRDVSDSQYTSIGSYRIVRNSPKAQLWFIYIVSIIAQLIWALSTNQEIASPATMAYYACLIAIVLISSQHNDFYLLQIFLLLAAAFFSFFWVAEDAGGYHDITEPRIIVEEGALKGIALNETDYLNNKNNYELLSQYVQPGDKLLVVFGAYSTAYLNCDALQAAGSPYNRTHLNDRLLTYWQIHPDAMPDFVLIDTDCGRYETYIGSECELYISENYTNLLAELGSYQLLSK